MSALSLSQQTQRVSILARLSATFVLKVFMASALENLFRSRRYLLSNLETSEIKTMDHRKSTGFLIIWGAHYFAKNGVYVVPIPERSEPPDEVTPVHFFLIVVVKLVVSHVNLVRK